MVAGHGVQERMYNRIPEHVSVLLRLTLISAQRGRALPFTHSRSARSSLSLVDRASAFMRHMSEILIKLDAGLTMM